MPEGTPQPSENELCRCRADAGRDVDGDEAQARGELRAGLRAGSCFSEKLDLRLH